MDETKTLQGQVLEAGEKGVRLRVRGGDSKVWYGHPVEADRELDLRGHRGVISYVPEELVLHVRAGTRLGELTTLLSEQGQMLPFEPPEYNVESTVGGAIAAGLSGPRRAFAGSARDFVLGITLLTGEGKVLSLGGQVMKNVAGYDVSRLMVGALGTLGVILDVSLKVLPLPVGEVTWRLTEDTLPILPASLLSASLGLSGHAHMDGKTFLRLSRIPDLPGEVVDDGIWDQVRNHRVEALSQARRLWRVSVARTSKLLIEDASLIEWAGAQRWLADPDCDPHEMDLDGHATLFRSADSVDTRLQAVSPVLTGIHQKLKARFDPAGLFNPGRTDWYAD